MRTTIVLIIFVLVLALAQSASAETTVFVNVNVIPMTSESVLTRQSVVVRDGRITELGSVDDIAVPKTASVVDGSDRFLIPGLAEMHAHVTGKSGFPRLATLFVANGVTTIRGMLGRHEHLELRARLQANEEFGPRLVTSGPSLSGRSVSGADNAADKVRQQRAAGFDFVKIHPGLDTSEFSALSATANELGLPFAGHVPAAAGLRTVLANNMATIDHLDGYFAAIAVRDDQDTGGNAGFFDVMLADRIGVQQVEAIAAETAAAGTLNVPTQVLVEQLIDDTTGDELQARPEMRFVAAATVRNWIQAKESQLDEKDFDPDVAARAIELRRRLILELHRAGAGLLLGSDAPQVFNVPGFSLHRELEVLVASGLTPYEALRTGTVAVAGFLNSNTGSIAPGRDADLVLLDANPLSDIRNSRRVHGVMVRGHWYSRDDLDRRLAAFIVNPRQ